MAKKVVKTDNDYLRVTTGRFTCAGTSAPSVSKGKGFTLSRDGVGQLSVALDEFTGEILSADAWIVAAADANLEVRNKQTSDSAGSFSFETHDTGVAADLTGEEVCFEIKHTRSKA